MKAQRSGKPKPDRRLLIAGRWLVLILFSLGLSACRSTSDVDPPGDLALRLDNHSGSELGGGGRRLDFIQGGRYQEYRYSDAAEPAPVTAGTYQKAGGSITLLSDRPGADIETLFRATHEGKVYWVGSEQLSKIAKPEHAALRQAALQEQQPQP